MKTIKDISTIIGIVLATIYGILSTICSAIVLKFAPYVTVVMLVLELASVTSYGFGTVLMYGALTWLTAFIIVGINAFVVAFFLPSK
jgi:hypothetical protein